MPRFRATQVALVVWAVLMGVLGAAGGAHASGKDRNASPHASASSSRQVVEVDGGLQRFRFGAVGSARTFSVQSRTEVWLRVTDLYCAGDRFRLLLDGEEDLGSTSEPTRSGCGERAHANRPRKAEPGLPWSSGGWILPPGRNVVTLVVTRSPFDSGAAVLRADSPSFAGSRLTGEAERPGPGDEDGRGRLGVTLHQEASTICYDLRVRRIDSVVAGHIHLGRPAVSGPVVFDLGLPPGARSYADCRPIDRGLLDAIAFAPWRYYGNVHTEAFPDGAVRGQLVPTY